MRQASRCRFFEGCRLVSILSRILGKVSKVEVWMPFNGFDQDVDPLRASKGVDLDVGC